MRSATGPVRPPAVSLPDERTIHVLPERYAEQETAPAQGRRSPAGPRGRNSHGVAPRRLQAPAEIRGARRLRDDLFRHGLLLGRGAPVLADARRLADRRRLPGRHHAQPDLSGDLHRPDRPCRGGEGDLRSEGGQPCDAAEDILGEPRSDAGHAPGQRCRHDLPLDGLHDDRGPARTGARLARRLSGGAEVGGAGADHHRDRHGPGILLRRGLPSAVSRQESERLLRPARHRRRLRHSRPRDRLPGASRLPRRFPTGQKFSVYFPCRHARLPASGRGKMRLCRGFARRRQTPRRP